MSTIPNPAATEEQLARNMQIEQLIQQQNCLQQQLAELQHQQWQLTQQLPQPLAAVLPNPQLSGEAAPVAMDTFAQGQGISSDQLQLQQSKQVSEVHSNFGADSKKRKIYHSEESTIQYNVPVSSRYKALENSAIESPVRETVVLSEPEQNIIKIPPIFVHEVDNFEKMIQDIKNIAQKDFSTKNVKNSVKVMFSDIEDFRNYRSFCDEENIAYYSFRDPTVKPLSVVIKDIPTSYSEEAIEAELLRLKYPVTKVSRLYNKERKPIHICAVELTNNSEARKIFALNKFLYSVIRVEQRFNARIVMCKKCQRYGHSQANCGFPPRCVKCVGNHHYKDCGKTRDSLPQCVNCNEYHAANYRGCKYYKTYVKEKTMPSLKNVPIIQIVIYPPKWPLT